MSKRSEREESSSLEKLSDEESSPANKKSRRDSGIATTSSSDTSPAKVAGSPAISANSDPTHSHSKAVDLLLVSANYTLGGVSFEIEKEARPDAAVTGATGSTQGDHVTAYISFLEFLYNITNDKQLDQISDHLIDIAKSILATDSQKKIFDDLKEEFDKDLTKYYSRDERKRLIAKLRSEKDSSPNSESDQLIRLKSSLKLAENVLVGQFVQNLGRRFIREINLAENIAFAKQGKPDLQEGNRVKQAVYVLRLVNELQQIEEYKEALLSYATDALQRRVFTAQSNLVQKIHEPNSELKQGLKRILETDPLIISKKTEIEQKKQSPEAKKSLKAKIENEVKNGKKLKGTVDEEVDKRISEQIKQAFNRVLDTEIAQITDATSGEASLFSLLRSKNLICQKLLEENLEIFLILDI